eukprot:TRINITY_DN653_c0_g1_i5.p1 TRINITY_DN653_c0_g1~~TRINITY_DN653_c0_g1_i5.p1  ORF type:complete len:486 (+),score=49.67 TRINITY_DN653_c0_g1_i5:1-1458(+)
MCTPLVLASLVASLLVSASGFDVRKHMSTTTRYEFRDIAAEVEPLAEPPPGCSPFHINLVARHGTRGPTLKRVRQLDQLAAWIKVRSDLNAGEEDRFACCDMHEWLRKWESPWRGKQSGGELVPFGEDEMFGLGTRLRKLFPEIFATNYHPEIFKIFSSQVPRASASAVAFGMGLFAGVGALGPGQHRAFSVLSESRANDTHLRFHDSCHAYKALIRERKPAVLLLQDNIYAHVATSLSAHLHLNLTGNVISALWLLCKQEAAVLDKTNQACSLFTSEQVELLEWGDDMEMYHLKGYGAAVNYHMATNLLSDILQSMQSVITASGGSEGVWERARLRFAHAETLIPFICLLGLFKDKKDVEFQYNDLLRVDPLEVPRQRVWKGSKISPFGANIALVLYKCAAGFAMPGHAKNISQNFLVQVLHNEQAVIVPGCGSVFCPFNVFEVILLVVASMWWVEQRYRSNLEVILFLSKASFTGFHVSSLCM